jgi:hypothetical protein
VPHETEWVVFITDSKGILMVGFPKKDVFLHTPSIPDAQEYKEWDQLERYT